MTVKLRATNLEMGFDDRTLFRIEQLLLQPGDAVWLRGDNGSGKTTLLKILAGLQLPISGDVVVTEHNHEFGPLGKVVYLHQDPYLFEGTVESNLLFGIKASGLEKDEQEQRIEQALDQAELRTMMKRSAQALSGGERQRLALARAWVLQPDCLLLDEPSTNLDPNSLALMTEMVYQLIQQGGSLILTSHQRNTLTALCNKIWRLEHKCLRHSELERKHAV